MYEVLSANPLGFISPRPTTYDSIYVVAFELWKVMWKVEIETWITLVQDNPKLLDDGGEMPKSQGRGSRYDSGL